MPISGKELVQLLLKNGWTIDRINGSHYIMVKGQSTLTVPVHGNRDMKPGTLNKILKDAGLK